MTEALDSKGAEAKAPEAKAPETKAPETKAPEAKPPESRAAKPSRTDMAYREIKQRIMGNIFPPGLQVLEQELAAQLGMSRTPVREALIRLAQEGLVEITPRRGMRVVPIAADDMCDIYEVLTCLESRAAERLAERRPEPAEIQPLIEATEAMDRALDLGDLEAWAAADEQFHRLLLTLSGNRRLAGMALGVFDLAHRARMVTLRMRPLPRQSSRDHRDVIDAILAGDPRRAFDLHAEHRRNAMKLLTGILERYKLTAV